MHLIYENLSFFCFLFLFLFLFYPQQQALAGTLVAAAGSAIETDPFKRQQAGPPAGMSWSTGSGAYRASWLLSLGVPV